MRIDDHGSTRAAAANPEETMEDSIDGRKNRYKKFIKGVRAEARFFLNRTHTIQEKLREGHELLDNFVGLLDCAEGRCGIPLPPVTQVHRKWSPSRRFQIDDLQCVCPVTYTELELATREMEKMNGPLSSRVLQIPNGPAKTVLVAALRKGRWSWMFSRDM